MTRRLLWLSPLILTLLITSPLGAGRKDLSKEQDAVKAADLGMARAVAKRDVEHFKTFVADDGVFLGAGVSRGPEAVAAGWAPFFDAESGATLDWQPVEVGLTYSTDLAYTIGDYELRQRTAEGETASSTGRYLTVWKKSAHGSWQVAADGTLSARDGASLGPPSGDRHPVTRHWTLLAEPGVQGSVTWRPLKVVTADSGDLAFALGEYVVRAAGQTTANGRQAAVDTRGSYFAVWRQEDGVWKVVAESVSVPAKQ